MKKLFAAMAIVVAIPGVAFAQEAEKPKEECCCEKAKKEGKDCCADMKKGEHGEHADHKTDTKQ